MSVRILNGDWIEQMREMPDASVQMIGPTSPPYLGLRSYLPAGHPDKPKEVGCEPTPDEFVAAMVTGFREAKRILRADGVFVLNLGDSMSGSGKGPTGKTGIGDQRRRQGFTDVRMPDALPPKNLHMIPFRVAMALQADGWILRSVIPWVKRNPMPESVSDRPASAIEYLFLFAKQARYFWDAEAIKPAANSFGRQHTSGMQPPKVLAYAEATGQGKHGGDLSINYERSARSYRNSDAFFQSWQGLMLGEDGDPLALVVNPSPQKEAHFASFPSRLVEPFIKAGTSERGCCPACRAPWVRVTAKGESTREGPVASGWREASKRGEPAAVARIGERSYETLRWAPSCQCDAVPDALGHGCGHAGSDHRPRFGCTDDGQWDGYTWTGCGCNRESLIPDPVPCVVLDPFGGSGTTGLVADRLGRDAVLIELNPEYAEMARRRIDSDAPMLTAPVVVQAPAFDAPSLFDALEADLIARNGRTA